MLSLAECWPENSVGRQPVMTSEIYSVGMSREQMIKKDEVARRYLVRLD